MNAMDERTKHDGRLGKRPKQQSAGFDTERRAKDTLHLTSTENEEQENRHPSSERNDNEHVDGVAALTAKFPRARPTNFRLSPCRILRLGRMI
ncbi:hypothetical protein OUZ56_017652 [Daphnia magna]|uniref:Uncharacterized protein n=1 Tax=Daphnia magna TaxID=35525 RepID=A0ABR0ATC1_9CRUS|nr:hypothetical protein OUZ56_017652 [Daphnia magna]